MCNSECITDLAFNMYCDCYIGPIVTWYTSVVIVIYVVMCLMSSSGIHKKLVAAGKKKGCVKVAAWARSVSNHLYWCAASSEGDGELMREKWLSILNHVANIHEGHGITFPKCAHEQLQEDRDWMIKALDDFSSHGDYSPYFIPQPKTVTFNAGQTATLQCSVENLGDKSITWKKSSEPNHISIDELIFDPDKRFNVSISRERREYDLKIFNVQPKDGGVYICQVSSTQLLIRHVRLIVLGKTNPLTQSELTNEKERDTIRLSPTEMPEIRLTGSEFVYSGETIRLVCNVTGIADVPNDLMWYKDGYPLRPSRDKKLSIQTDSSVRHRKVNSVLEIKHSALNDTGTYLCFKSNIILASQKVIVLQDVITNPDKRGTAGHATSGQICNKQWWTLFMTMLCYICITNIIVQSR